MIGVDWGTSSLRAFRLAADGSVLDRRHAPFGIMHVENGAFGETLTTLIGEWLDDGEKRVILSGMIGSRQGWREAAYLPCPAGIGDLATALMPVRFERARAAIVPGLISGGEGGVPEVMRGEETQIAGIMTSLGGTGVVCLPGSHSKWARIEDGQIARFSTYMTGEAFSALRSHTILGRLMTGDTPDQIAFEDGVARSDASGGLLHHVFGARTLVLTDRLSRTSAASYLSGILIGHEIRGALASEGVESAVHLVGEPDLCALYARALRCCGVAAIPEDSEAAIAGLFRISELAPWS